jgi:hypothetical protein
VSSCELLSIADPWSKWARRRWKKNDLKLGALRCINLSLSFTMSLEESLFKVFQNSHKNVKISALSGFISAISTSLFLDALMTIFIFNNIATIEGPDHKNEMLGAIETAYGVSELLFAIPIGYIADKYNRTLVLRSSAVMEYTSKTCTQWPNQ